VNNRVGNGIKITVAKTIDLAVGTHLREHVLGGYRYLMENYKEGDRIILFGFSRGAYTARALAGMLEKVGLLDPGNHENVPFAYKKYVSKKDASLAEEFKRTFARSVNVHFVGVWYVKAFAFFYLVSFPPVPSLNSNGRGIEQGHGELCRCLPFEEAAFYQCRQPHPFLPPRPLAR
jgi:uncharacterized protein (DUF2235 family)